MTRPASGEQWGIGYDGQQAVIVEAGGGIRSYELDGVPVLDGYAEDEACPAGHGQVLVPWPNRIRDGRYAFGGTQHQLALTEPAAGNAIHGLARNRPWRLVSRSADAVTVDCQLEPQQGYPFSLLLTSTWSLSPDGLRVEHTATNTGPGPLPFGLGVHPYLLVAGQRPDDLTLTVPADRVLRVDDRQLPVGDEPVEGTGLDFRTGWRIGATRLDTAFAGLHRDADGVLTVSLTAGDGRGAQVWGNSAFGWVQVFTADTLGEPRRRRSVAIEPMTCPPDAFNSGDGVVVLQPTQRWSGSWGIRPIRVTA